MPSFAVGSAYGEPSSPATPTTTTIVPVPPPEEQPERRQDELPPQLSIPSPASISMVPHPTDAVKESHTETPIISDILKIPEQNISGNLIQQLPIPGKFPDIRVSTTELPDQSIIVNPQIIEAPQTDSRIKEKAVGPSLIFNPPMIPSAGLNGRTVEDNRIAAVHAVPKPLPPDNGDFPDWGHGPPQVGSLPIIVNDHNPIPHCTEFYDDCLPRPVVPNVQWNNSWTEQCEHIDNRSMSHHDCNPPADPNIFVINGNNNEIVIVNNDVVNQNTTNLYVTNLDTGSVYDFPYIPHGRPFAFPSGWCGGVGGSFAWSAGIHGQSADVSFGGGGVFNVNAQCGLVPPTQPHAPLVIAISNDQHYTTDNYIDIESCGCIYVANTYIYGHRNGPIFVPTSWTPDIVTQPARQGLPPFLTGTDPTENRSLSTMSWSKVLTEPLFIIGLSIVMISLAMLIFLRRHKIAK